MRVDAQASPTPGTPAPPARPHQMYLPPVLRLQLQASLEAATAAAAEASGALEAEREAAAAAAAAAEEARAAAAAAAEEALATAAAAAEEAQATAAAAAEEARAALAAELEATHAQLASEGQRLQAELDEAQNVALQLVAEKEQLEVGRAGWVQDRAESGGGEEAGVHHTASALLYATGTVLLQHAPCTAPCLPHRATSATPRRARHGRSARRRRCSAPWLPRSRSCRRRCRWAAGRGGGKGSGAVNEADKPPGTGARSSLGATCCRSMLTHPPTTTARRRPRQPSSRARALRRSWLPTRRRRMQRRSAMRPRCSACAPSWHTCRWGWHWLARRFAGD